MTTEQTTKLLDEIIEMSLERAFEILEQAEGRKALAHSKRTMKGLAQFVKFQADGSPMPRTRAHHTTGKPRCKKCGYHVRGPNHEAGHHHSSPRKLQDKKAANRAARLRAFALANNGK